MDLHARMTVHLDEHYTRAGEYAFGQLSGERHADECGELELRIVDERGAHQGYLFGAPGHYPYRITGHTDEGELALEFYPDKLVLEIRPAQITGGPMDFPSSPTKEDWLPAPVVSVTSPGVYEQQLRALDRVFHEGIAGTLVTVPKFT